MREAPIFSISCGIATAPRTWTSRSRASLAPAASRKIEKAAEAASRRRRGAAQFHTRRLSVDWRERTSIRDVIDALERIGYRAHPFEPERGGDEEAAHGELADHVPGGRRLRRDEHHAAVGVGLVRQRHRHHAGDARPVPLAVGADRAAGRGLCRASRSFSSALACAAHAAASTWTCRSRSASCWRSACRWSRPRSHAEHAYFDSAMMLLFFLLCGRCARSCDAAQDPRGRRQSRGAQGRDRAPARSARRGACSVPAAALQAGDRIWSGRANAFRPTASCSAGHPKSTKAWSPARPTARKRRAPARQSMPAASTRRRADDARRPPPARARCSTRSNGCSKRPSRRSRAMCGSPTAPRGCYAPVVHAAAALTLVGWLVAGASVHDAIITAIAVLIITCPCALALAIPAVQVVAAGTLFRSGIFLNAGDAIERLAEADTVVFDKTGTLTLARTARRQCRRRSIRHCWSARRGLRCRAVIRWRPRSRARRASAAVRRRDRRAGEGVRAIDRRRRGAAWQPGILRSVAASSGAIRPVRIDDRVPHGARKRAIFVIRQTLRPDAEPTLPRLRAAWASRSTSCRATVTRRSSRSRGGSALHRGMRASRPADKVCDPGRAESQGPPRADGRRRHQRRGGACRRRMCRWRRSRPPISRRRRPTRCFSATVSRPCATALSHGAACEARR